MRALIGSLVFLGLFLIGFAVGKSPQTARPIQNIGSKVAGLSRLVERRLPDTEEPMTELLSARSIDETYKKLHDCYYSEDPCPGFNMRSERDYKQDVMDYMVEQFDIYYAYLKEHPLEIHSVYDEQLAKALVGDIEERVQYIGIKLMGLFPVTEENMELVTGTLSLTLDEELFREGIDFLNKKRSENPNLVSRQAVRIFQYQIRHGTDNIAAYASGAAFDFMNQYNISEFKNLRASMKSLNFRRNAIDSSIREFERQQEALRR